MLSEYHMQYDFRKTLQRIIQTHKTFPSHNRATYAGEVMNALWELPQANNNNNNNNNNKTMRNINLQAPHFLYIGQAFRCSPDNAFYIYLINKYISLSDICLTVHHRYK